MRSIVSTSRIIQKKGIRLVKGLNITPSGTQLGPKRACLKKMGVWGGDRKTKVFSVTPVGPKRNPFWLDLRKSFLRRRAVP